MRRQIGETSQPPLQPQPQPRSRLGSRSARKPRRNWLHGPKSAVWLVLAAIVVLGGGRRLYRSWRARRAVAWLDDPDVTPERIEEAGEFGRAGAWELLRIFSTTGDGPRRQAAGRALARLWREDQLIAEEEQGVVRRGLEVQWKARRRYPRALRCPIPITASYSVPFLNDDARGRSIGPNDLEWSHRLLGTRRASLETSTPWRPGAGRAQFQVFPDDFATNGPHRLVLEAHARTKGLTSAWEIELPHAQFQFEFDPLLRLDAILALPDAVRDEQMARAVRLAPANAPNDGPDGPDVHRPPALSPLNDEWALRAAPELVVALPLPCDLAHQAWLEFEEAPGWLPAGAVVLGGQGEAPRPGGPHPVDAPKYQRLALGPVSSLPAAAIERPGTRRVRVRLAADPALGWAGPDVRSVWPGELITDWAEVEVLRR